MTSSFNLTKLSFKHSYLQLEKEEVLQAFEEGDQDIRKFLLENYPEQMKSCFKPETKSEEPLEKKKQQPKTPKESKSAKKSIKNKDVKKLYRKIASKLHPDKVGSQQYSIKFDEAVSAYEDNNLAKLLNIASRINMEITDLSPESYALLQENINFLENEINMKKKTFAYQWHTAENDKVRKKLVYLWFKEKGIEIND